MPKCLLSGTSGQAKLGHVNLALLGCGLCAIGLHCSASLCPSLPLSDTLSLSPTITTVSHTGSRARASIALVP